MRSMIRSGKDGGFIAGADITEFTGLKDLEQAYRLVRQGQQVFDRLEALPMPTVAAIHGFALGGGLELALACDYRVGADDGKLEPRPAGGHARQSIRASAARCARRGSSARARRST